MRSPRLLAPAALCLAVAITPSHRAEASPSWSMNATAIEACSCPMFCQCYFNSGPAGHGSMSHADMKHDMKHGDHMMMGASHEMDHYCKFNNAYRVNSGHYGDTKLDGAKFWLYGDLGGDFSKGNMDWSVVTFDASTTPEQRKAIGEILPSLFPVKWNSFKTAVGDIDWQASGDEAHATLDGGKTAEVKLSAASLQRGDAAQPMVIQNLRYWGAQKNDGFVLMPNTIETLRTGDKPYEYKGTNGFMITFDLASPGAAPAKSE